MVYRDQQGVLGGVVRQLESTLDEALFESNVRRLRGFARDMAQQHGNQALASSLADVLLPRWGVSMHAGAGDCPQLAGSDSIGGSAARLRLHACLFSGCTCTIVSISSVRAFLYLRICMHHLNAPGCRRCHLQRSPPAQACSRIL